MIPAGKYRARGINAALGKTSKGNPQVGVEFNLLDDEEGRTITWYGYFTDKTKESTFKALRTCGWEGDDLSNLNGIGINEVHLVIEHDTNDKGERYARVRWVNSTGGLAMKDTLGTEDAKAFAARMRGDIAAFNKSNGGPKPQPRAPAPRDENDDDRGGQGDDDTPF